MTLCKDPVLTAATECTLAKSSTLSRHLVGYLLSSNRMSDENFLIKCSGVATFMAKIICSLRLP